MAARPLRAAAFPMRAARARLQPVLSPRLNKALADAAAAEAPLRPRRTRILPPLLEGDIFSSLFEGPTAWKVGACSGDDKTARCAVALHAARTPGQKPVSLDRHADAGATRGGWKVDDIAYDASFAFGNTGTLSEMLKMVLQRSAVTFGRLQRISCAKGNS